MVEQSYARISALLSWIGTRIHPLLRRLLRLIALPWYFMTKINWEECDRDRLAVAADLLHIFFVLRYYPDNYAICRLWELPRDRWPAFYGSIYNTYPRQALRRGVHDPVYNIVFRDKEVCSVLCDGSGLPQPRMLGIIDETQRWRPDLQTIMDDSGLQEVIVKPVRGAAGQGIVLAQATEQGILIRTHEARVPLAEHRFVGRFIVQEIVEADEVLGRFSPGALSTMRVVTYLTISGQVLILGACIRVGANDSFIDNWSMGGVAIGVETETGQLLEYGFDKHGRRYRTHPDTGLAFAGFQIPRWNDVVTLASRTQREFGYYRLLGLDLAVTENGPVLIEINGEPDIVLQEQTSGPILDRPGVLEAFTKENLLYNDRQKALMSQ
jgi:glutathione synthase/RimK-type ligase-like ATP-grasp enzyme